MTQRPTHKKCRHCGEWFSFSKRAPLKRKFCSMSCASSYRNAQPKWKAEQSRKIKARTDPEAMRAMAKALWQDPQTRAHLGAVRKVLANSKEHKVRMEEHNKKMWSDPDFRQRHVERTAKNAAERWTDPDYREKMSVLATEGNKKRWANPSFKKKTSFRIRVALANPLTKKRQSKQMRERMNQPEAKARVSQQAKELWQDPAFRTLVTENSRETALKSWSNPTFRKQQLANLQSPEMRQNSSVRMKARMAKLANDPEWRATLKASWTEERKAKCIEENKKRWADPVFKARVGAAISAAKKRNKKRKQQEQKP